MMIIYIYIYYNEVDMFDSVVIVTKVGYTDQHNMINSSTDGWRAKGEPFVYHLRSFSCAMVSTWYMRYVHPTVKWDSSSLRKQKSPPVYGGDDHSPFMGN